MSATQWGDNPYVHYSDYYEPVGSRPARQYGDGYREGYSLASRDNALARPRDTNTMPTPATPYQLGFARGYKRFFEDLEVRMGIRKSKPRTLHVAMVITATAIKNGNTNDSRRIQGDWAGFIGDTQEEALEKAENAARLWGERWPDWAPYTIAVGTLTHKVVPVKPATKLVAL